MGEIHRIIEKLSISWMPKDVLIRTFYNGVTSSTRDSIDAKAEGFLMRKTVDEAAQLLDRMALDNCLWS